MIIQEAKPVICKRLFGLSPRKCRSFHWLCVEPCIVFSFFISAHFYHLFLSIFAICVLSPSFINVFCHLYCQNAQDILNITSHSLLIFLIRRSESFYTFSFLCQNNPVSRNLKDHYNPHQDQRLCQKSHPHKANKICHIHGIAGKSVYPIDI